MPRLRRRVLHVRHLDRLDDSVTVDAGALGYRGTSHGLALRCPRCRRVGYREEQEVALHDRVLASYADVGVTSRDRCLGFWLEEGGLDRLHLALLKLSSRKNVDLEVRARAETKRRRVKKKPALPPMRSFVASPRRATEVAPATVPRSSP